MKRIALLLSIVVFAVVINLCGTDEYGEMYQEKISQLREDIYSIPTNAENFSSRLQLANHWYDITGDAFTTRMSPIGWEAFYNGNKNRSEPFQEDDIKRLDEFLQKLDFADGRGSEIAEIRMESSDRALAYHYGTWTMVLSIGKLGIADGGSITVHHKNTSDWGSLQTTDPTAANYLKVTTTGDARLEVNPHSIFPRMYEGQSNDRLQITVRDGHLIEGNEVRIVFGDKSGGGPGRLVQSFSENDSRYYVLIDYQGNGIFLPVGWGAVNVEGAEASKIVVTVPSIIKSGETLPVKIRVEDAYRNFASNYSGTIQLKLDDEILTEVSLNAKKTPASKVEISIPDRSGIIRLKAEDRANNLTGISNPVRIEENPEIFLYWGELHGHTAVTDGIGTIEEFYQFARDQAFCDYAALSEHCQWISDREWQMMHDGANYFNDPGKFVALIAFEWTQRPGDGGGHHNVYFFGERCPLLRRYDYTTKQELFKGLESQLKDETVIVIPHAHAPGDWRKKDHMMERFAEIYSKQGVFEWFGNRFLEKNYVGFVSASDDHTGHPGNTPGVTYWRCNGGLTAIYSEELSRESFWNAMEERHVYGTTGARIFLDVKLGGHCMGERFSTQQVQELTAEVSGTDDLAKIELLRDGKVIHTEDFLSTEPQDAGEKYLLLFSSSSEPPGGGYGNPRDLFWDAEIEMKNNRISSSTLVGVEIQSDNLILESPTRITYQGQTRGDKDGMIFEVEHRNRGSLEFKCNNKTFQFSLKDLPDEGLTYIQKGGAAPSDEGRTSRGLLPPGTVTLRTLGDKHVRDYRLQFIDPDPLPGEHYYYVHVTQIDEEQAWSSPIWVTY